VAGRRIAEIAGDGAGIGDAEQLVEGWIGRIVDRLIGEGGGIRGGRQTGEHGGGSQHLNTGHFDLHLQNQ